MGAGLRRLGCRVLGWLSPRRLDADFSEELDSHLAMLREEYLRRGMSEDEAARAARLRLGGMTQLRERNRELHGLPLVESFLLDLRYALLAMVKRPGFAAVVVVTLALGIGANAAIFSAVSAMLLRPLPFANAERLVAIWKKNPARGWTRNPISSTELLAWRDRGTAFEGAAAFRPTSCVLSGDAGAEEDPCEVVGSDLFPLLGVAPARGRLFTRDEDAPGAPPAAILSHGLWQRRFGGEAAVVGRAITVNGASHTVVGVMPERFSHLYASPYGAVPELWISGIALSPPRTWNDYQAVGRLRPGMGPREAAAQLDPVSVAIAETYPDLEGWRADLVDLRAMASRDNRSLLTVLTGAVAFILLIACANVANLSLARGSARENEFAMRQALGAGRGRLVRQVLTESLLLSLWGGALGVLLAWWGSRALAALAPASFLRSAPGLAEAAIDRRVLLFTLAVSLGGTVLVGLAPALQAARMRSPEALKETGRGALAGPRRQRARGLLVVTEIALATVLLVGAGLMLRTLAQLARVDLGFEPAGVLTLRVPLSAARYQEPQARAEFWRRVVASVEALPGVESASVSRGLPIEDWAGQFFTTAERPDPPAGQVPDANYLVVGPGYFRTLRIPLRRGRIFDDHDTREAQGVVIVNEELARTSWPGQDPLGKQLRLGSPASRAPWLSVVGVAGNVLSRGPDAPVRPEIYVPLQQYPWVLGPEHLVVRAVGAAMPERLAQAVVREVQRVDKDLPATDVRTMEQLARTPIAERRMVTGLLGGFAALALVLSALGIYGVLWYAVAQRTREIGLRVALGARPGDVLRLVVASGARLAGLGIAIGICGALALTRVMSDLLYGVRPTDPTTFAAGALVLAAISLAACSLPARRAAGVDPAVALRHQ